MKQYTDVTVLVDRSSSMVSIKDAMESAFGEFLLQHRAVPSTRLSLIQFDSDNPQDEVYIAKPVADAPRLVLYPRGCTPLNDAVCRAIDNTGKRLAAMPEAERPDQVLFVIITDGYENASLEHTAAQVHERTTRQTNQYQWQFVYLGANQDAFAVGAALGIAHRNTINYATSAVGIRSVGQTLARATTSYTSRMTKTADAFTDEERIGATTPK